MDTRRSSQIVSGVKVVVCQSSLQYDSSSIPYFMSFTEECEAINVHRSVVYVAISTIDLLECSWK